MMFYIKETSLNTHMLNTCPRLTYMPCHIHYYTKTVSGKWLVYKCKTFCFNQLGCLMPLFVYKQFEIAHICEVKLLVLERVAWWRIWQEEIIFLIPLVSLFTNTCKSAHLCIWFSFIIWYFRFHIRTYLLLAPCVLSLSLILYLSTIASQLSDCQTNVFQLLLLFETSRSCRIRII